MPDIVLDSHLTIGQEKSRNNVQGSCTQNCWLHLQLPVLLPRANNECTIFTEIFPVKYKKSHYLSHSLHQYSLSLSHMPWPICTIIARNRIISEFIMSRRGFGVPIAYVQILVVVSVSLHQQHINNRCKIEHENVQRWWILIYVCCFILLLPCMTACKLMDTCLFSLRLQYPLPKLLPLHWWWWSFFLIVIVFVLV